MRKGLLLFMVLLVCGFASEAQTVSRLKSWGFLDSPPSPVKSFSIEVGGFQLQYVYPKSQLLQVNPDGTLTLLANLRKSSGYTSIKYCGVDSWAMFAYSESSPELLN